MSEPTRGATEDALSIEPSPGAWRRRRVAAHALRVAIVVTPFVASAAAAWGAKDVVWSGDGAVGRTALVLQLAAVGVLVAVVAERALRRFVPLVHLLQMTLVFPDQAPSRYSACLRTGTVKQQQKLIETVRDHGFSADEREAFSQLAQVLVALGDHERLTRGHTERVRAYTDLLAVEMGLPEADRQKLHWAALLHDIGKLTVPAELLSLPGRPSEEEWQIIKSHPARGAEMVRPFEGWLGEWTRAAGDHHERWDGGGYPAGLVGLDISLAGRIVAVADAYDVITSARSYKKAMSPEAARAELVRCAGTQFDPAVVRAFLRVSIGDLRSVSSRFAWAPSVPAALLGGARGALTPVVAAAGLAAVPLVAAAATSDGVGHDTELIAEAATQSDQLDPVEDLAYTAGEGDRGPDVAGEPSDTEPTPSPAPTPQPENESPDPGSGDSGMPRIVIPGLPGPEAPVADDPIGDITEVTDDLPDLLDDVTDDLTDLLDDVVDDTGDLLGELEDIGGLGPVIELVPVVTEPVGGAVEELPLGELAEPLAPVEDVAETVGGLLGAGDDEPDPPEAPPTLPPLLPGF